MPVFFLLSLVGCLKPDVFYKFNRLFKYLLVRYAQTGPADQQRR
jgi:hypothetical protein